MKPLVSVIVPTLNEERYIVSSLQSLMDQDYPKHRYEVIIIDCGSTDRTLDYLASVGITQANLRVMHSPGGSTAMALNIGVRYASGEIIVRLDAHSLAPSNYIAVCVKHLMQRKADNVGGIIRTVGSGYWGCSIAMATSSPFGVGDSAYRCFRSEGYDQAGWPGAFWKETLLAIGGYDEGMQCNEDDDLNYRLIQLGKRVFRTPEIEITYFCRDSVRRVWVQFFRYGYWKVPIIRTYGSITSIRHLVPACFVIMLAVCLAVAYQIPHLILSVLSIYVTIAVIYGIRMAASSSWTYAVSTPVIFAAMHLSYGIGFLLGIVKFVFLERNRKKLIANRFGQPQHDSLSTRDLMVFDDQVCWFDGSQYSTDEAHLLFIVSLRQHFRSLTFWSRVADQPRLGSYRVPSDIQVQPLSCYETVPQLCTHATRYLPPIWKILKGNVHAWDVMLLAWPHPISLLALVLVRIRGARAAPVIVVRQNLQELVKLRYSGLHKFAAMALVAFLDLQLRIWPRSVLVLTTGREMYDRYKRHHRQVVLISTSVFPESALSAPRPLFRDRRKHVLFVGRLEPEKGVELLLQAISMLKDEGKGVQLDIVGDGPRRDSLESVVTSLRLEQDVCFHGYVSFDQRLFSHYLQADIFVLPSLSEGIANVLIEAMGLGVPIIATRVPGTCTLLRHRENSLLVTPGSAVDLCRAIVQLSDDTELAHRLSRQARLDVQDYTMEVSVKRFCDAIHDFRCSRK